MKTYDDLLTSLCYEYPELMVLTAENRAAIRTIGSKIGDRFVDTGITEQTMIGMAAGMAIRGKIPVVHALAAFLTMRAFEFIRTDIGIGALPVKIVGYVPGILSEANGPTHQAIEDIALMRGIPGVNVFAPADIDDLIIGLPQVILSKSPWYIRYNHLTSVALHSKEFLPGKAEVFSRGEDITILSYGALFNQCYQATEMLSSRGYSTGLVNMRTLKPVDTECIKEVCKQSALIIVVEDHFRTGGLYTIVAETCLSYGLNPKVMSISFNEHWYKPALLPQVLEYEGLTAADITSKAVLAYSTTVKEIQPSIY